MADQSFGRISVRFKDNVAVVQMNNGENRIDLEFLRNINAALDAVLQRDDIEALVTTGEGKFYSNGINLTWIAQQDQATYTKFWDQLNALMARILTFPVPTVAALNGHAFAGGAFLAFCHDFRVMNNKRGWICVNEVHLRMRIPEFLFDILKVKIPNGMAQSEVIVLGKRMTAVDSLDHNLVTEICAPEELMDTSIKVVTRTIPSAGYDRPILQHMKRDLYAPVLAKVNNNAKFVPHVDSAKL